MPRRCSPMKGALPIRREGRSRFGSTDTGAGPATSWDGRLRPTALLSPEAVRASRDRQAFDAGPMPRGRCGVHRRAVASMKWVKQVVKKKISADFEASGSGAEFR